MEQSEIQMRLARKQSFIDRVAYLISQHAMVIIDPAQTPNPNADDLAFAKKVIANQKNNFGQSIAESLAPTLTGSPNVRTTASVDTSGEVYTTVTDAAFASQIATYWNFFATSGF